MSVLLKMGNLDPDTPMGQRSRRHGTPEIASKPHKLGETHFLTALRGKPPCSPDFSLLVFRTVREYISVVLMPLFMVPGNKCVP